MKSKILLAILAFAAAGNLFLWFIVNQKVDTVVVVDVIKVFNQFDLKKEAEQKADASLRLYKSKIDSIQAIAQTAEKLNDRERAVRANEVLLQLTAEFRQATEYSTKNLNELVWTRLNPMIDEYGEKHGYRIIIGANGMGSILYNTRSVDRTEELISFINQKFQHGR